MPHLLQIQHFFTSTTFGRSPHRANHTLQTFHTYWPGLCWTLFCKDRWSRRNQRSQVFVCLSTKAVHLESVASLTKEDCFFALNRFIARRGMPSKISSDIGTNFLGARSDLIKTEALLNKEDKNHSIISFAAEKNCEWITIPPRAPHFGWLWEAAIKSMKRHLRRVVGTRILQLDEFQTIMAQIEAVLNSRNLFALYNGPNDPIALTPAHFSIGNNMLSMPSGSTRSLTMTKRYKLTKKIQDDYWKLWKKLYLTELQVRKKWFQDGPV